MRERGQSEASILSDLRSRLDDLAFAKALALNETRADKSKYLNVDKWLPAMLAQAQDLDLHQVPPMRILDIGTGPGYFPFICRHFGHDCIGLDKPGIPLFAELCAWVGTEVVYHRVLPSVPLPEFKHRFDLVTAFRSPFNTVRRERRLFTIDEWDFFLDDLRDNTLRPGGAFVMKMNEEYDYDGPVFGTPELMSLFTSRGATLSRDRRVCFEELR